MNQRVVGLEPGDLANIENVVLAATGLQKVSAILAALRGGFVNTLLVDKETATRILTEDRPVGS